MAKNKKTKHVSSYGKEVEHHSTILLLAGGLVVVLCVYFLGANQFMPKTVYAPSSQVLQPVNQDANMTIEKSPTSNPDEVMVNITSTGFSPATINVNVGSPVTFTNNDTTSHTATVYTGTIDTGVIPVGMSKTISFHTAGTYTYTDLYNKDWTGTIIVK